MCDIYLYVEVKPAVSNQENENRCAFGINEPAAGLLRHNTRRHPLQAIQTKLLLFLLQPTKMLSRIFFACLLLGLYSSGSSLSCRWMSHKFRQYSEISMALIDSMVSSLICVHGLFNNFEDGLLHDVRVCVCAAGQHWGC